MSNASAEMHAGNENMLIRCGGLRTGARVLIVSEPAGLGYYDDGLAEGVARGARALGLTVEMREEPFSGRKTTAAPELTRAMQAADMTIFLARLGDQLRFDELPPDTRAIVSYAISEGAMVSSFARLDHGAMSALRGVIDAALIAADEITITCPAGTDVKGRVAQDGPPPADTTTKRFPRLVHTPMPAARFSGQIAQCGFLVGTGSQYYDPYACRVDDVLLVRFERNRITGFDGAPGDVARAQDHYRRIGALFGIDDRFVHSWHAGMHPACNYAQPVFFSVR